MDLKAAEVPALTISVPTNMRFRYCGVGWDPLEDFDALMPDLDRLMKSLIAGSTDRRNVNLHFDNIYGELQAKLASILRRREVVFLTRENFFGMIKVSLGRHVKSLIQKYTFTYKRTGVRPPKKGAEQEWAEPYIEDTVEEVPHEEVQAGGTFSLNQDEIGAENFVGEEAPGFKDMELKEELDFFIRTHLTAVEAKVMRQEIEPNDKAMSLAYHSTANGSRHFKISDAHKAEGIGMPTYIYKRVLLRIKGKLQKHWTY